MKKFRFALLIMLQAGIFVSCKKDAKVETRVPETQVTFNFKASLNNLPLNFNNTGFLTNQNGDSLNVSLFNYYVSNVKLTRTDGFVYSEPESYHLIRHNDVSFTHFTVKGLPEGNYNKMEFIIGVDSARNVSGARDGDLDPAKSMFWDWNTGYIFLKLEGKYKTVLNPVVSDYAIHIGGFCLPYNCIRQCGLSLPEVHVADRAVPAVYLNVLVDEIFKTPAIIDLDTYSGVVGGKNAKVISANYVDMFVVDHVVN